MKFSYEYSRLFRTHDLEPITIYHEPRTVQYSDFFTECVTTARQIGMFHGDIVLGMSGSWESQVCLESFVQADRCPEVFIHDLIYNDRDVDAAQKICQHYGIKPNIIKINGRDFYSSHALDLGAAYQITDIADAMYAHTCERLGVTMVLADAINIRRDTVPREWSLVWDEKNFWSKRYNVLHTKTAVINDFFNSRVETVLAFLNHSVIKDVLEAHNHMNKISVNSVKHMLYEQSGFKQIQNPVKFQTSGAVPRLRNMFTEQMALKLKMRHRPLPVNLNNFLHSNTTSWTIV